MVQRKNVRSRGKLQFSKYFQEFEKGDSVAINRERSINSNFPKRLQGRTGKIDGKKGRVYIIKIKDLEKEKKFLIEPIHLTKIKNQ
ncbi:MAG: 50S ribosomal protein L21e [Candidatus Pacearchaeota archaeon]